MWKLAAVGAMLLAALLSLAEPAGSQTTGRIEGRVLATTGAPLPGVSVTVDSPSLQGSKTVETRLDGSFRQLSLPPGDYDVEA